MRYGVDRYKRAGDALARKAESARLARARERTSERLFNDLWRTLPARRGRRPRRPQPSASRPSREENILYFIEKNSPKLETWQRELVRIVRKLAQYFYPQGQTKVMNEGWATFWHYTILNRLYDKGLVERRLHARVPAVPHQRRRPARLRRARLRAASTPTRWASR